MKLIKIALMLCVTSMVAQSNFVTGSVTTKNNQILNGEIDYQDWKKHLKLLILDKVIILEPISLKIYLPFK